MNKVILKLMTAIFYLDSDQCNKDCGPGGTCLKEKLMPKDDAVCRCDKAGFNKTEDGKCVGGCSLVKHYLSGCSKFFFDTCALFTFFTKTLDLGSPK